LPQATIVVDHWHLVRLANQMLTEVRQRVAREQLHRRGRKVDPAWAHRRLLLRAGDKLGPHGRIGEARPATTHAVRWPIGVSAPFGGRPGAAAEGLVHLHPFVAER
jgi:Transposase